MNKTVYELNTIDQIKGDDLIPVYDLSEAGAEKLKKVRVENLFWEYDSIVNTTSGTQITLTTSIPSGANTVEVIMNGVSTGTNNQPPIIRLGDAGGVEPTGYVCVVRGPTGETSVTDGFYTFRTNAWNASDILSGRFRLTRWDNSLNLWLSDGLAQDSSNLSVSSGRKTLTQELTTVVITTPGGAASFDLGSARVRWMG